MSSVLRIDASRANGAKSNGPVTPEGKEKSAANAVHSTGPRTPEGKHRASRNSLKHGVLASTITLRNECPDSFKKMEDELRKALEPRTYIDEQLLEAMTSSNWRRKRAWCIEKDHFDRAIEAAEADASPETDQENSELPSAQIACAFSDLADKSTFLKNIRRYEVTNSREFLRHLNVYETRRRREDEKAVITKRTEPNLG